MEGIALSKPYESYESGDYLAKNPSWDEEDSKWKANQVLKVLDKNHLKPKTIIEVGCGAGGVLASLHDTLPDVKYFGVDIAADARKFWVKHAAKKITFSVGDFLQLQTAHSDLLLLLDVIEHIPNPFEFLTQLKGRSDYYIFHIPLDLSSISVLRETPLLFVRNKVGHIHYFTKSLALSLLHECDYEVIDWNYTNASFSNKSGGIKKILSRIVRGFFYYLNKDLGVRLCGGETLIVLAKSKF
jgi:SAM-dependent methyltransferase